MDATANLKEHGYAIVRGVYGTDDIAAMRAEWDRLKTESKQYSATFREKNLLWVIRDDPAVGRHLRFVHWPSYISEVCARYRTDPRQLALIEPLLGRDIKQISNQATWKTPGAADTTFGWHQDARFRRPKEAFSDLTHSYFQTLIAVDRHDRDNGCLKIVPDTHHGPVELQLDKSVMDMDPSDEELARFGLDPESVVYLELEPGDMAIWSGYTVHASEVNRSSSDRRACLNGYMRADTTERGEWAFKDGKPCALGEHQLVQYDDLYIRPEPHYVDGPSLYPYRAEPPIASGN